MKKPKKPKRKTIASIETYKRRLADYNKKMSQKQSDKKKLESLKRWLATV